MKKIQLLMIALLFSVIAWAQPLPPDDDEVPIGTDIIMLVAAGGAYFYKNIFGFGSKKSN